MFCKCFLDHNFKVVFFLTCICLFLVSMSVGFCSCQEHIGVTIMTLKCWETLTFFFSQTDGYCFTLGREIALRKKNKHTKTESAHEEQQQHLTVMRHADVEALLETTVLAFVAGLLVNATVKVAVIVHQL